MWKFTRAFLKRFQEEIVKDYGASCAGTSPGWTGRTGSRYGGSIPATQRGSAAASWGTRRGSWGRCSNRRLFKEVSPPSPGRRFSPPRKLAADPPEDLHVPGQQTGPGQEPPDVGHEVIRVLGVEETHLHEDVLHLAYTPRSHERRPAWGKNLSGRHSRRKNLVADDHDGVGQIDGSHALRYGNGHDGVAIAEVVVGEALVLRTEQEGTSLFRAISTIRGAMSRGRPPAPGRTQPGRGADDVLKIRQGVPRSEKQRIPSMMSAAAWVDIIFMASS